jgi:predicted glycosyltransferase involved in capsule biosynthesis
VIGMGNENYEIIDRLESIAKSLESLAESQKKIADTLEWMAKRKENVD